MGLVAVPSVAPRRRHSGAQVPGSASTDDPASSRRRTGPTARTFGAAGGTGATADAGGRRRRDGRRCAATANDSAASGSAVPKCEEVLRLFGGHLRVAGDDGDSRHTLGASDGRDPSKAQRKLTGMWYRRSALRPAGLKRHALVGLLRTYVDPAGQHRCHRARPQLTQRGSTTQGRAECGESSWVGKCPTRSGAELVWRRSTGAWASS